ncbi:hypothetical protein WP12_04055 [Sphingomonas sp. SRS2]|nr:hypothetical protein WP12_04055 [Sphingomonas sp. SRS2]
MERAAKALCELDGNPPNATMDGKPLWRDYVPEVLAVVKALREPSEAMVEAAGERWNYSDNGGRERRDFEHEWRAAIDAIAEQGR